MPRPIRNARMEYFYLYRLNKKFAEKFNAEYPEKDIYSPFLYAGMLFNMSMAWLDSDCKDAPETLAKIYVDAIYFE